MSPDEDGTELADIYTAQSEAVKLCGAMLRELGARFWNHGEWRVDVHDAAGLELFSLAVTSNENGSVARQ